MLFGQYDRYIRLKLAEDDGGLAEQMTGYPAKEDEIFADSFREQMDAWFGNGKNRENCEGTEQAGTWKYAVMEPALALGTGPPECIHTVFKAEHRPVFGRLSGTVSGFSGLVSGEKSGADLYWKCLRPSPFPRRNNAVFYAGQSL